MFHLILHLTLKIPLDFQIVAATTSFFYCPWNPISSTLGNGLIISSGLHLLICNSITSWEIDGETVETVSDFILGVSKITADDDCSHEIKRSLLLGRKVMTNLDSIFKSRDITLPTKVHLVKTMVFEWSCMDVRVGLWRRLNAKELMLLNCVFGEGSWESLGLQWDPTSPFWRRSVLDVLWKEWC